MTPPLLELEDVCLRLWRGARSLQVLDHVSLELAPGEFGGIWADRRAGKTTLLAVIAGSVRPDSGRLRLTGHGVTRAEDDRPVVGLADRSGPAMPDLSVIEWVAQTLLARHRWPTALREARRALDRFGIADAGGERWSDLADDERALVAIAYAVARRPRLVLVDDLAADLGAWRREATLGLLHTLTSDGTTVLMASTNASDLKGADRIWSLEAGRLVESVPPAGAEVLPLRRTGTADVP